MGLKSLSKIVCISTLCLSTLYCLNTFATDTLTADVGYVQISDLPNASGSINPIRLQALQEASTDLGANGALAWRSLQINHSLEKETSLLDHVFNFNQLLLSHNVLPPVLTEGDDATNLSSNEAIRIDQKTYKIVSPARFVTAAPTWRTYLWMNYDKPTLPDHSLLPTTKAEALIWNGYFKQGWKQGLEQANDIFAANLSQLKRDYAGIILYRKLLAEHMVSAPYVAEADLGVTGDGNEIHIQDQVLRITAQSQLEPNSAHWTPVLGK